MVYPFLWTAVCYVTVITFFVKKVGVVLPNFGGPDPLDPQWLRPWFYMYRLAHDFATLPENSALSER